MDTFTQQITQWLQTAEISYILTPILLFAIFIAVLLLIRQINKMITLLELISHARKRIREEQLV